MISSDAQTSSRCSKASVADCPASFQPPKAAITMVVFLGKDLSRSKHNTPFLKTASSLGPYADTGSARLLKTGTIGQWIP